MKYLALFTALLLLVGCTQQERDTSPEALPEINIGRLICGGHLPLAIVEKKLQHRLQGFRLNTIQNHSWDDVVQDLKSGKLAGTFILSPLAMQLIREGLDASIVMMANRNGNGFVLSKAFKSISDLKGNQNIIAVPHRYSQHYILAYLTLEAHGVPLSDITMIAMPPRDMITALERREIDGFMVGEPEGNRSVTLNHGWLAAISPQIWENHMDHVFLVSHTFIQQHPQQLQSLVTSLYQAGQFIEANPHQAAIMGEDYTGANAEVFEQVLTTPANWIDYSNMMPSANYMQAMAEMMVKVKLWDSIPHDLHTYTNTHFIKQAMIKVKRQ